MEQNHEAKVLKFLKSPKLTFLQDLLLDLAKQEPSDPILYSLKWLEIYHNRKLQQAWKSGQHSDEEQGNAMRKIRRLTRINSTREKAKRIVGKVFPQKYLENSIKESFKTSVIPKSQQEKSLICSLLKNSIFFKNVSPSDEKILVDAIEYKQVKQGENIITQGQNGSLLFIVESGLFDCSKFINEKDTYLKTYSFGELFGQLALLYDAPRAASIRCKESGKLFTLDRGTFKYIMTGSASKKRIRIIEALDHIQLFSGISAYEKQQICDALVQQKIQAGEYVIKEGERGDKFYIVHSGMLFAEKQDKSGETKIVYRYRQGDYFGELALLNEVSRQASVKAQSDCSIYSIGRESFFRLLGSLSDILQRNKQRYNVVEGGK